MENKINIAELLRNCPKGMELDCTMFENLEFDHINKDNGSYPIICRAKTECGYYNTHTFTEYGCYSTEKYAKCVILPKGKTTWEGFHRPFVDGDVVATDSGSVFILKSCLEDKIHYHSYIGVTYFNKIQEKQIPFAYKYVCHLATEEEKQKLFDAIKAKGYCWNGETKTLKKLVEPKFKVGDKVKHKCDKNNTIITITGSKHDYYYIQYYNNIKNEYQNEAISFTDQDKYELVIDKFDINTLKPFESKVLVKPQFNSFWMPSFFGFYSKDDSCPFICCNGFAYKYCIPFEGNEHLLGTTNDCDDFYKY